MAIARTEHVELPAREIIRGLAKSLLSWPFFLALFFAIIGKTYRAIGAYYILLTLPNTPLIAWGLIAILGLIAALSFGHFALFCWQLKKKMSGIYRAFREGTMTEAELLQHKRDNLDMRKPMSITWIGFIAGQLMWAPILALMLWSVIQVPYLKQDQTKAFDASPQATLKRNMPLWEESGIVRPFFKNH